MFFLYYFKILLIFISFLLNIKNIALVTFQYYLIIGF